MDEQSAQANVTSTPVSTSSNVITDQEVDAEQPAGVPEGAILDGGNGTEKVVHDLDEQGNVIGWHKEPV